MRIELFTLLSNIVLHRKEAKLDSEQKNIHKVKDASPSHPTRGCAPFIVLIVAKKATLCQVTAHPL